MKIPTSFGGGEPETAKDPSAIVIPFGKHKGSTVAELLAKDPPYVEWVMTQGWVAERFAELHKALASRGAGQDDSPEHNALQARFLEEDFRQAFLEIVGKREIEHAIDWCIKSIIFDRSKKIKEQHEHIKDDENDLDRKVHNLARYSSYSSTGHPDFSKNRRIEIKRMEQEIETAKAELELTKSKAFKVHADMESRLALSADDFVMASKVAFEDRGVDVVLSGWMKVKIGEGEAEESEYRQFAHDLGVEIKPSMGDDYPTVMRQMQRLGCCHLLLGAYTGRGVSEPQMRAMFKASGITVVFLQEIEEAMRAVNAAAAEAVRRDEAADQAAAIAAYEAEEAAFWEDEF
jgi:hypothetical protein